MDINTAPQHTVVETLRRNYPSFVERTQFSKFAFRNREDASAFARHFKPTTTPNVDTVKGNYIVQL